MIMIIIDILLISPTRILVAIVAYAITTIDASTYGMVMSYARFTVSPTGAPTTPTILIGHITMITMVDISDIGDIAVVGAAV